MNVSSFSYWEQSSFLQCDYLVVGAGITGLSTAASILEKNPAARVTVLERGLLPSGASTKNAGFACFGSVSELWHDFANMGDEQALALIKQRYEGLQALRKRLGDTAIGFEQKGGYELFTAAQQHYTDCIDELNAKLRPYFKQDIFSLADEKTIPFGFNTEMVSHLVYNPLEGQVDTGKLMRNLHRYVSSLGALVLNGCTVEGYEEQNNWVDITASQGGQHYKFKTPKVAFCTNAFTPRFFPDLNIQPGRGLVLVTSPIKGLSFEGAFHLDEGFYYFRDLHGRVLLGGGRNLDFEGETTTDMGINPRIEADLHQKLRELILPGKDFSIDYTWSGIMAFGPEKSPLVKAVSERIVVAARLSGMGVALSSTLGHTVAGMLQGNAFIDKPLPA
jgi:glycine/D-amino acid oxidase-like deaminating enzyme